MPVDVHRLEALGADALAAIDADGSYRAAKPRVTEFLTAINVRAPFTLPARFPFGGGFKIWFVSDRIHRISADTLLLRLSTQQGCAQSFALQRVANSASILTFSSALVLFAQIFRFAHATRSRGMRLPFAPAYPIGPRSILYQIPPSLERPRADFSAALPAKRAFFELRRELIRSFSGHGFAR
jgi:hypothetical protein